MNPTPPSTNKQTKTSRRRGKKSIRSRNWQAHHFGERLYPPTCHDSFKIDNKNAMALCKIGDLRGIVVKSSKQTTMPCAWAEPHLPKQPRCLIFREFLRGGWWESNLFTVLILVYFPACCYAFPNLLLLVLFFLFPTLLPVVWKGADFSLQPTSSKRRMIVSTRLLHCPRKDWKTFGEGIGAPHHRKHSGNQHSRGPFT